MKKIVIPAVVLDANIVSINIPENDCPAFSLATTYGLGDLVMVTGVDVHQIYSSVHAANTGNDPLTDSLTTPVHWSLVGATNAYKIFDTYTSSQAAYADQITFTVKDLGVVNAIGLLNIDAASASIVGYDISDVMFYDQTVGLTSYATFTSYYDYYFTPFLRRNVYVFEDIPPVNNARFVITITAIGTVKIGNFVAGYGYEMSPIHYSSNVRQKDYSIKQQLPTGEYFFEEGATSTIAEFFFTFPNEKFDLLQRLIQTLRARPALYVGSDLYESTILYGIILDAPSTLTYAEHSQARMQIESLI